MYEKISALELQKFLNVFVGGANFWLSTLNFHKRFTKK